MSATSELVNKAREAVAAFLPGRRIVSLKELGAGHINDTILVVCDGPQPERYVLQRLNRQVFPRPELIMANLRILADHLDCRLRADVNNRHFSNWQVVRPVRADDGRDYYIDPADNFWRMLNYVGGAANFDRVRNGSHAHEAGRALGFFHWLVSDLNPGLLADTLPGFHVTSRYLADYDQLLRQPVRQISTVEEGNCARVIEAQRIFAQILEDAARNRVLPVRVIHGDPKLANIIFDRKSGQAVSLVDLDTVKPGLLHYDIGDCLRSCCNPAGENVNKLDDVRLDLEICRNLLGGYLAGMAPLLTDADYEFIYPAFKLITFELGLRFFADHLAGDRYFKVDYDGHNLQRAMAQFKLMTSIEASESLIRNLIKKCRQDSRPGS